MSETKMTIEQALKIQDSLDKFYTAAHTSDDFNANMEAAMSYEMPYTQEEYDAAHELVGPSSAYAIEQRRKNDASEL